MAGYAIASVISLSLTPYGVLTMELQGGDKMAKVLSDLAKKMTGSVRVGFLEGETYPDGTPVPAVAFWNEFGTSKTPARPFFRSTITDKSDEWSARIEGAAKHYDFDGAKVLEVMGQTMAEDIQSSITGWQDPPNADSTIAKKGFNSPLRDTNQMHDSVKFEVTQ